MRSRTPCVRFFLRHARVRPLTIPCAIKGEPTSTTAPTRTRVRAWIALTDAPPGESPDAARGRWRTTHELRRANLRSHAGRQFGKSRAAPSRPAARRDPLPRRQAPLRRDPQAIVRTTFRNAFPPTKDG